MKEYANAKQANGLSELLSKNKTRTGNLCQDRIDNHQLSNWESKQFQLTPSTILET